MQTRCNFDRCRLSGRLASAQVTSGADPGTGMAI